MLIASLILLTLFAISVGLWFKHKSKKQYFTGLGLAIFTAVFAYALMKYDIWQAVLVLVFAVILCIGYLVHRTPLSGWAYRVAGFLSVMFFCLAVIPFYLFPNTKLPAPDGPWNVGTQHFELTDTSRNGAAFGEPGIERRLFVRVWYPTDAQQGRRRPYLTHEETKITISSVGKNFRLGAYVYRPLCYIKTHAFEAASISQTDSVFPTLIFSHGYWSWVGQNTALMEKLASHGYIIYSVAHPWDGGDIPFEDGSVIKFKPEQNIRYTPNMLAYFTAQSHEERFAAFDGFKQDFDQHRFRDSLKTWGDDVQFLMSAIQNNRMPKPINPITAKADMNRFAMIGMSFGGSNITSECHKDIRCKAAVNLDGEEFDWGLYNVDVRMPLLMMQSDWHQYGYGPSGRDPGFYINDYAYEAWQTAGQRGDVYRIRVKGLQHLGFADLPLTLRMPLRNVIYGRLEGQEAVVTVNETVLAFLDKHVKEMDTDFPNNVLSEHSALDMHDPSGVAQWWTQRQAGDR